MKTFIFMTILMAIQTSSALAAKQDHSDGIILTTLDSSSKIGLTDSIANYIKKEDLEYNCREVRSDSSSKFYIDFGESGTNHYARITCYPRSLKQKQILSLQRACEKEAHEECFSKDFLNYLDTFEATKFNYN
jgi:hypothetical protein